MKNILKYSLRVLILALILLPLLIPFLEKNIDRQPPTFLTVWVDSSLQTTDASLTRARTQLRNRLALDPSVQIQFRSWGSVTQSPVEDHEELLAQLDSAKGPQVLVSRGQLWGPAARHFRRELERLYAQSTRSLRIMRPEELGFEAASGSNERYLALSELSAPQLNFLGEPSQLSLDIVGKLNAGETQVIEVIVRSGEALLASRSVSVKADDNGIVNAIENIPVHFTRAQQQLLTAELATELSPIPLNLASTSVSVVHSKSTVLHIGVGPDWSLRSMRTKLKFWPNLDLLSYYILREINDDLSIPSNQLSLIEFPAEKLFGEQLPNFHGVLAQNFAFDSYLNEPDSQHLYDYVNTSGGRLVMQAGPLSFLARDSNIRELMPCENIPEFDLKNEYRWQTGQSKLMSESQFEAAVNTIVSKQTAIGCKPKAGALVLAETADESRSPVVVAYPVGKGLVLTFLAGDWHTFGTQSEAANATQRAQRVYALNASEFLFQWMVEFLQRRQDSGLRPPQFAGPRVYRNDPLLLVRSRGGLPAKQLLQGLGNAFSGGIASPVWLPRLGLEAIKWERSAFTVAGDAPVLASFAPFSEASRGPKYEQTGLNWQMNSSALGGSSATAPRTLLTWPILEGTAKNREILQNPTLFPPELLQSTKEFATSLAKMDSLRENRTVPLLEAYPWLMALALALLALEQLLGRLARGNSRLAADRQ